MELGRMISIIERRKKSAAFSLRNKQSKQSFSLLSDISQ